VSPALLGLSGALVTGAGAGLVLGGADPDLENWVLVT